MHQHVLRHMPTGAPPSGAGVRVGGRACIGTGARACVCACGGRVGGRALGFTWIHLDSLGLTWIHWDSFGFT